ncbi:Lactate-binding periplasmic protein precursor [Shimia sp. SK013]|uniref:C4-dicarboxylate TRAP transporter substrate-binding protein n=1 Tax=Shimia sp. SK013 TaxID=1389006 RepID=UPI0006B69EE3|nr:C4-dicarboxylate TRAP transporter substrate-binding protein [Shimia sp. SK013]KPA21287.1 Lactate-binding periplasmic protein precursor [Shimia sp. SK013]
MKRFICTTALTASLIASMSLAAHAQDVLRLNVGSSHPEVIPWVANMKSEIVDRLNPALEEAGVDLRVDWTENYGGVLYGVGDTLEAVSDGLVDMGWVGALFEPGKMPVHNAPYAVPFSTPDPIDALEILDRLSTTSPLYSDEWTKNNMVYLGTMSTDGYQIFSKTPIRTPADLKGLKVLGVASIGPWIEGYGATFVNTGIPALYNQLETGVGDAAFLITSGALSISLHEVGNYVTVLDMGPAPGGGVAMNLDTWESLPLGAQTVLRELGQNYNTALAKEIIQLRDVALNKMEEDGATLIRLTPEERAEWADALPDIAGAWVAEQERRGVDGRQAIDLFLSAIEATDSEPLRDWSVAQ